MANMMDPESEACNSTIVLSPGTIRLEDMEGDHIVLSPQPTSDPNDPLNWTQWRKGIQMFLISMYTLMAFAVICIGTPLWASLNIELGFSYNLLNDAYGVAAGTLCIGCIMFVPFALRYGRRPVYVITWFILTAVSIWSAKTENIGDWMAVNAIGGAAAAVNETLYQLTISDLFFVHQRGTMNGLYVLMVLAGNYLAPVVGGYINAAQGWRWAFWYCTIFCGIFSVISLFLLEETKYHLPVVNGIAPSVPGSSEAPPEKGEKHINPKFADSPETQPQGNNETAARNTSGSTERALVEIDHSIPLKPYRERFACWSPAPHVQTSFWHHFYQPFVILFTFPAIAFAALQYGFTLAALSVLSVTQADLFPYAPYDFSTIGIGNLALPPFIGGLLGAIYGGPLVDWYIIWYAKRNGGIYEPEMRLHLFFLPGVLMPAGLLLYGLTTAEGMPWIITCIGGGFIGFGIGGISDISVTYIQDSYKEILGDGLVGVAFVRNIFGTILVFVISPMISGMGVYNMFVFLGVLSFGISATYIPMLIWGKKMRIKCAAKYAMYAKTQYDYRPL
ncbi:hypothetical protein BP6252_09561 [Coleophoma cylindrospora]|uniref:Major facilitator superfamily (MFS) profile domain-containing protein n=1 Tax=Coleophoma cylindrospora TaxID=1849047 RepID=A0A3D8R286_9HELO|nr:hypothetical protein BP6252_09561 [Coleophoma cylindrospora]